MAPVGGCSLSAPQQPEIEAPRKQIQGAALLALVCVLGGGLAAIPVTRAGAVAGQEGAGLLPAAPVVLQEPCGASRPAAWGAWLPGGAACSGALGALLPAAAAWLARLKAVAPACPPGAVLAWRARLPARVECHGVLAEPASPPRTGCAPGLTRSHILSCRRSRAVAVLAVVLAPAFRTRQGALQLCFKVKVRQVWYL